MFAELTRFRPPRIAMTILVVATAAHFLLPFVRYDIPAATAVAATLAVLGFGIMMQAWWLFRTYDVAICPAEPTSRLITAGAYRLSRNPMYLGMVLMLLALAVFVGTLPFFLAALCLFLIIDRVFCPFEERKLEMTFGEIYRAYRARVRRWL